ncbi:unnamed protein product [Orchesella dallaii]|uniref:THO complex subunit 7 n=1 Tax=Orchesella dallaii TaxID=48710 RepID=A0ABP1RWG4_9HEXA
MESKPKVHIPERWIGKEDSVAVKGLFHHKPDITEEEPKAGTSSGTAGSSNPHGASSDSSNPTVDPIFLAEPCQIIRRRLLIDGDGAGDEKKLNKLIQYYVLLDTAESDRAEVERNFKTIMSTCEGLRCGMLKTLQMIDINEKAEGYWIMLMDKISEELQGHRTLVIEKLEKLAELKLTKQRNVEASNAAKLLEGTTERETSKKKLAELEAQCDELKERDAELGALIAFRKHHLDQLCNLAKRLTHEEHEEVEQAVKEAEERVLSDISIDLD